MNNGERRNSGILTTEASQKNDPLRRLYFPNSMLAPKQGAKARLISGTCQSLVRAQNIKQQWFLN